MDTHHFIQYESHTGKIITTLIAIFIFLVLIFGGVLFLIFWYPIIEAIPLLSLVVSQIRTSITEATLIGLLYAHFLGGLFFVPSPDEIIFYYALLKGNPPILALGIALFGYMAAQLINYFLGKKVRTPLLTIISKEKLYQTRRFVNKYGSVGVFLFNVLPFPAPLLTFALGIARYNIRKLFILTIAGKVIKYLVIIGFYFVVT